MTIFVENISVSTSKKEQYRGMRAKLHFARIPPSRYKPPAPANADEENYLLTSLKRKAEPDEPLPGNIK